MKPQAILALGSLLVAALALAVACHGTFDLAVETTPGPEATLAALATENARLATQVATMPLPTPAPQRENLVPALFDPPPEVIFRDSGGELWYKDAGGIESVFDRDGLLAPDGTRVLYQEHDDIWLADLTTGERRNLTETPDRVECCPLWWPARPDVILFVSRSQDEPPPCVPGFLTAVGLDGSGYRVLDEEICLGLGLPSPSPDGQTIAYGGEEFGWLYRWDAGPEPFDPAHWLSSLTGMQADSPSWSPDGKRLAWVVGGYSDEGWQMGIGVFDLEARTAHLLHPYEPAVGDDWPPTPAWSPDGRWLAFETFAQNPDEAGLWVVRADEWGGEYHLGAGSGPLWSPDSHWLAFTQIMLGEKVTWIAKVGTWSLYRPDLSLNVEAVGWVPPDPDVPVPPQSPPESSIGGGTVQSGPFTFTLLFYEDDNLGHTTTLGRWARSALPGVGLYADWTYHGPPLDGPIDELWGTEGRSFLVRASHRDLQDGDRGGRGGGGFPGLPGWDASNQPGDTVRWVMQVQTSEGTYGAAIRFVLGEGPDGFEPTDISVEALPPQ